MPVKILMVEDDDMNRKLFVSLLQGKGHEIFEAVDGPQALDLIREMRPEIIFQDMKIPGMSGLEVFYACRSEGLLSGAKVFAFTADASSELYEAGFDGIITKPIRIQESLKIVGVPHQRSFLSGNGDVGLAIPIEVPCHFGPRIQGRVRVDHHMPVTWLSG